MLVIWPDFYLVGTAETEKPEVLRFGIDDRQTGLLQ
jgi:hypothetical protein